MRRRKGNPLTFTGVDRGVSCFEGAESPLGSFVGQGGYIALVPAHVM